MGVKVRKRNGAWWVFIDHHGIRKAKKIGTREAAQKVKRELEARLALGETGCLSQPKPEHTFSTYAEQWLRTDALRCKPSTVEFYKDYQARYVKPRFGETKLSGITREEIKAFMADLKERGLSKNTIRLAVASLRVVLSSAVEDGILAINPALRLGRLVESRKSEHEAQAMEAGEAERFLNAAKEHSPRYYVLFLIALRAGLRQGEVLALKWGDLQFGQSEQGSNRFLLVQRRWYRGHFSTPKGNRPRRVDMSRELRQVLIEMRDQRLLDAYLKGQQSIGDDLLFPGEGGNPISVRTLSESYFLPALEKAGLRRFRFHDLRHTFGSLLIEAGAPLPYVKDQMGHSSIQITADKYIHLISGRNVGFIDRLDAKKEAQPSATQAQPGSEQESEETVSDWCERGDSNPHGFPRQILSLVRLPIPPLSHRGGPGKLYRRAGRDSS